MTEVSSSSSIANSYQQQEAIRTNEEEIELFVAGVWSRLREEAEKVQIKEPLLQPLLYEGILKHREFKDALAYRLATKLGGELIKSEHWLKIIKEAYLYTNILRNTSSFSSSTTAAAIISPENDVPTFEATSTIDGNSSYINQLELNLEYAACIDLVATFERDPACDSLLTAFMYFKGYKALQIYRIAHKLWQSGRTELACLVQSRTSEVFAVDIHPAAKIGKGLMMDHATGLVIGETAVIGDNCSFLHGVTLGGTGKSGGDRHPKLGNNVSIGCNASILGNIRIGDGAKIGAGSVVLKAVPAGATAVGSPARILQPKLPASTPELTNVSSSLHLKSLSVSDSGSESDGKEQSEQETVTTITTTLAEGIENSLAPTFPPSCMSLSRMKLSTNSLVSYCVPPCGPVDCTKYRHCNTLQRLFNPTACMLLDEEISRSVRSDSDGHSECCGMLEDGRVSSYYALMASKLLNSQVLGSALMVLLPLLLIGSLATAYAHGV